MAAQTTKLEHVLEISICRQVIHREKNLTDTGFVYSDAKCEWESVQIGEWLGFAIDTITFVFKIQHKRSKYKALHTTIVE